MLLFKCILIYKGFIDDFVGESDESDTNRFDGDLTEIQSYFCSFISS